MRIIRQLPARGRGRSERLAGPFVLVIGGAIGLVQGLFEHAGEVVAETPAVASPSAVMASVGAWTFLRPTGGAEADRELAG